MPNRYDIVIRGDDEEKFEYMTLGLAQIKNTEVAVKNYERFKQIAVLANDENAVEKDVLNIVSESAVLFAKSKFIVDKIGNLGIPKHNMGCLIGSIISLGYQEELALARLAYKDCRLVCPDAFLTFIKPEIAEKWQGETEFAARLISDCNSPEDALDLTLFLLSLDGGKETNVKISKDFVQVNGIKKPHIKLFKEPEIDAVISAVKEKPLSITIEKTSDFSQGFLETIRALGR